jgi:mono/diheme cytochrome c family protein
VRVVIASVLVLGALAAAGSAPEAQSTASRQQLRLFTSVAGQDSFKQYCAPCHGTSGRGDGPVAAALKTRPSDLTALARRNNGNFPQERIHDMVAGTGGTLAAHGTSEMPIWGEIFRAFESEPVARQRIQNIVTYLGSLQVPTTAPGDPGSRLFRTHCGSCHGAGGLGNGPVVGSLRHQPPDLTKFAARNGGVFPTERLHQIIDGRFVPSHGDRDMPVWGDVFRDSRDGADAESAKARIDAILRFLAGIQQRAG